MCQLIHWHELDDEHVLQSQFKELTSRPINYNEMKNDMQFAN